MNGDPLLLELITLLDSGGVNELSITVSSNGQTVTGHAIPGHQWFGEQAARLGTGADELGGLLNEWHARAVKATGAPWSHRQRSHYIHLRGARFVGGGGIATEAVGFLWRCRLASVTGWTLDGSSA